MKLKLIASLALLASVVSAHAQITKHRKYDWGWSYKLEMPETGLKCEFPERPVITTLAYGYMTAASFNDELFIAAKLENPFPYDLQCRTDEFVAELRKVYGLPLRQLQWGTIATTNGHLTATATAKGGWAQFHIDAVATEEVLTIFIHAHHGKLSVPGHFFVNSYDVNDMATGTLHYATEPMQRKHAKHLPQGKDKNLIRLENTGITLEWPALPEMEAGRHGTTYVLENNGSRLCTRVIGSGPAISYAFFQAFVAEEQQRCAAASSIELLADETEMPTPLGSDREVFFRKLTFRKDNRLHHRFYLAANEHIVVQELETATEPTATETRYLNTFEQSVRNRYDTRVLVLK